MTRRDVVTVLLAVLTVVFLILMLFVTLLGLAGRGIMGRLMQNTHGVMFFLMVSFPLIAVVILLVLAWWIFRRENG